jgi:hypothetical protein
VWGDGELAFMEVVGYGLLPRREVAAGLEGVPALVEQSACHQLTDGILGPTPRRRAAAASTAVHRSQ